MAKLKYHEVSKFQKRKFLGEFYDMVSLLKNRDEVQNFLKDLLTPSEAIMVSRRIQVAKMLLNGLTYEEIIDRLGVGSATIQQVDRWLNRGFGGYQTVIKKHNRKFKDQKTQPRKLPPYDGDLTLNSLRRKYPGHFLLLNFLMKD